MTRKLRHVKKIVKTLLQEWIYFALRSRFAYSIFLDLYSPAELAEIVRRAAVRSGFALPDELAAWIGRNAAGEPRKALHLLRSVRTLGASTAEGARDALAAVGLMHRGLSRPQHEYLSFLAEVGGRGPEHDRQLPVAGSRGPSG